MAARRSARSRWRVTLRDDSDHDALCASGAAHVLVVAPPGTGKTAVSVRLAGTIVPDLAPESRVLLVTFSNQARVQLEHEAARQLRPELRRQVEVANYHGFFRREVWAYRRALGLPLRSEMTSWRRRLEALKAADTAAVAALKVHKGFLEAFAEQRFARFHDERTPDEATCERLLAAIQTEIEAGHVTFDDLGALFWEMLETYAVLDEAYKRRYPVVIADEHQDASELQDAVVRRLGHQRLIILADPLQLIYGFRGSKPERLDRHAAECDERFELRTPHRWHGQEKTGRWLLAVRARLEGQTEHAEEPAELKVEKLQYFNQMLPRVKSEAASALNGNMDTVAVVAAFNADVGKLRSYLCKQGLYPRQLGGGDDFEEARGEIEQLPLLGDVANVAAHAIDRIAKLVPTLKPAVVSTVRGRLTVDGANLAGNCGAEAKSLLRALAPLYEHGPGYYFASVVDALDACSLHKHHLPRIEAVRALRSTADAFGDGAASLDEALQRYADSVATAAQAAPRLGRGLFVMTAHQAKGKEFDVVIIVSAGKSQFPDDDDGRRLFYVAITRASKRWVVLAPQEDPSPLLRHLRTA
jgi:UvrD/REP helicase N-terminal domain/UvrD-like helicase C-terminal domain